jgi:hypothetical protein
MSARTDAEATEIQNITGVTAETLKAKLEEQLQATHVEIEDMSGMLVLIHGYISPLSLSLSLHLIINPSALTFPIHIVSASASPFLHPIAQYTNTL